MSIYTTQYMTVIKSKHGALLNINISVKILLAPIHSLKTIDRQ